jgi:hypothetical protein
MVKDQVPIEGLSAIAPIDVKALSGRVLCTGTFYISGVWQLWFPGDGQLIPLGTEFPAEGLYFGDGAAQPYDLHLPALDLIAQHAPFEKIRRPFVGICDDIYNLATSMAKVDGVIAHQSVVGGQATRMVITEVEYMAIQCRSVFDSIQKVIRFLWSHACPAEDGSEPRCELPESFGDMVLKKASVRTTEEIVDLHAIPVPLALVYARHAAFFADLKRMRDVIVHKTSRAPPIFVMEEGAYIHRTIRPFSSITAWRDYETKPNDLVPLRPALGAMIHRTLRVAQELVTAFSQVITLGSAVCPNHRLYLRAYSGPVLAEVLADANQRYMANQCAESAD